MDSDPWASFEASPVSPGRNASHLSGNDTTDFTPDSYSLFFSILIYIGIMSLVLLPLLPCWNRCCGIEELDEGKQMERRKAEIAKDVITKKVLCHGHSHMAEDEESAHSSPEESEESTANESSCDPSDEESIALSPSVSNDDGRQCAICLESFSVGDEVSWSKNQNCNHVYHRECITQWLLKHDECPTCRNLYLCKDPSSPSGGEPLVQETDGLHHCACPCHEQSSEENNRERCKFCVVHGLVDPERVVTASDDTQQSTESTESGSCDDYGDRLEANESLEVGLGDEHVHAQECACEHCLPDLEMGSRDAIEPRAAPSEADSGALADILAHQYPRMPQQAARSSWLAGLVSIRLPSYEWYPESP